MNNHLKDILDLNEIPSIVQKCAERYKEDQLALHEKPCNIDSGSKNVEADKNSGNC